jgi:hypothetical protein
MSYARFLFLANTGLEVELSVNTTKCPTLASDAYYRLQLYYVLVITCIFARKAEWLRGACLAAALVFPAVASLHALVLASTHVNGQSKHHHQEIQETAAENLTTTTLGAVDMDIYGAFQFCSIAILAAPLTVRLSRTYFYDPGRNVIFLWTILILMGLIALCVEFYRANPVPCTSEQAQVTNLSLKNFPYGNTQCNLICNETQGPKSPLRGGAASEIFVVPVPTRLTFNAAMLLAAGFCIPVRTHLYDHASHVRRLSACYLLA